jgi:transposase
MAYGTTRTSCRPARWNSLGRAALGRPDVLRLMTIPRVDTTVALSIVAAVGDFTRFRTPDRLVSYLGLNPPGPHPRASGGLGVNRAWP